MKQITQRPPCRARALLAAFLIGLACHDVKAAVTILGAQYQPDQMFPEYNCIWHDKNYPTSCPANVSGCNVHVYLKNTGASAVTISDATLAGYSLATSIQMNPSIDNLSSIYFHWDTPPAEIIAAGEPVWFKVDPSTIPAGGVAQVVIRLRYIPTTPTVTVGVAGLTTNITVDANAPQLARVGFAAGLTNVTLHWRRNGGAAPTSVWMDGINVTANTTTVGDPNVNFGVSVISLAAPLSPMSYHVFQGVYADGKTATASIRAWANKFIYSTYGIFDNYSGHDWIVEAAKHGVNNCQLGGVGSYLATGAGQADAFTYEFGYTCQDLSHLSGPDPDMWFLNDEPDAEEDNQSEGHCGTGLKIPCGEGHATGTLAMHSIAYGETLRAARPMTPTTVNMDGTLKPGNYQAWGQAVDILQVDPYYQRRLSDTYWYYPARIPLYKKATYVYAVSRGVAAAAEPNPSNVLLYSCEWHDSGGSLVWPFPTAQSKRIEVYYALAGGATGMGYWWLNSGYPSHGLSDQSKQPARDLWKEMGLLGNEIKTARPLLVTSTPVALTLAPSANVWAQSLASGTDTILLLVVNDNYYNDQAACHYTPVGNATVTATLPSWMKTSPTAFEIAAGGLSDVSTVLNGSQLQVNLGTLNLTKMIVLTTNPQLRSAIQQRYTQQVLPGICAIAPELCVNNPPAITQQPSNQSVAAGGTANFTVVASGTSPLSYQWRKNNANLSNGGHYAGSSTGTLTVTNADSGDAASYRCVVTNAYGSVTSSATTLTIAAGCSSPSLLNGSFEGGTNAQGVATSWVGYQRGTTPPTTLWSIQTASPPGGAGAQYQQMQNTTSAGGGGVRQDITGCIVGATYQVAGWMRGNSGSYSTCTVKCSPSASTEWSTATNLTPVQSYTGSSWTPILGTVVATGTSMTLWLDGQTGGTSQNKAECFDAITVTCLSAPTTPPNLTQQPGVSTNCEGATVTFSVAASGSGLTYQWQQNDVDLGDDGHYLGCATGTLTITNVDTSDAANYRCRVSNATGWTNSVEAGLTVKAATTIAQHPSDANVALGGTVQLSVAASGYGTLGYQWQRNQANLSNGGHYSGCTTARLAISEADNNDAASYSCVVSGGCGIVTSSQAGITVGCALNALSNGDFESGNTGGVASGWTAYQRAPNPTTAWSIQTVSPPAGGGLQYQQIANSSSTGGGGVRQDVTGCTIGAIYQVSGWMRGNSTNATCTVQVSPSASTDWSTAIDLNPPQAYSGTNWTAFSGTVVATGPSMTLWLDGQTGGSGLNKAECFDSVTVSCVALHFESVALQPQNQVVLTLSGPFGGNVTIRQSSDLVNWLPLTNLINSSGTLQFTEPWASNAPLRFYRVTSP